MLGTFGGGLAALGSGLIYGVGKIIGASLPLMGKIALGCGAVSATSMAVWYICGIYWPRTLRKSSQGNVTSQDYRVHSQCSCKCE